MVDHSKSFSNANVYNDHLNSKKHRENVLKGVKNITVDSLQPTPSQEDTPMKKEQSDDGATIPPNTCLFCPRSFTSLDIVLKHMAHNHAFYIPDASYCSDIPGLLAHLAEDIALGNICIFCGHGFGGYVKEDESDAQLVVRAKKGLKAVREHMVAKNHCRIPWDTELQRLELSEYYNYESSYPDYNPSSTDIEMVEDDGEWQDDDDSSIDEDDEVIMDYSALERKTKKPMEQDLDQRIRLGENDYELVLPSGARIGHRALKGVYKQNVMRASYIPSSFLVSCFSDRNLFSQPMSTSTPTPTKSPSSPALSKRVSTSVISIPPLLYLQTALIPVQKEEWS